MATTTIAALLQAAFLLLTGIQGGKMNMAPAAAQQAVNIAGNAVQIATQAEAPIGFAVAQNDGIWPNMRDLLNAPYRAADGAWVRLGNGVQLVQEDTSFGDLNHDGMDDAAVVVKKSMPGGTQGYFLAAMLNQGGIMFDIAEMPLGTNFAAAAHAIASGTAMLNGKHYQLIGNALESL